MSELESPRRSVEGAIAEHHSLVYRLAYRVCGNGADAEDVTQTTYLHLLDALRHDVMIRSMPAWLARVSLNNARKHVRGESRRRSREEMFARDRDRAAGEEANMASESVERALDALPADLRWPVILHYQEGLKYHEVAEVLECPAGTVARRISTAKDRLREKLSSVSAFAAFPGVEAALGDVSHIRVPEGIVARLGAAVASASLVSSAAESVSGASSTAGRLGSSTSPSAATGFGVGGVGVLVGLAGIVALVMGVVRPWSTSTELAGSGTPPARPGVASGPVAGPVTDAAIGSPGDRGESVPVGSPIIAGRVVDGDGRPVIGAAILLMLDPSSSVIGHTRTDGDGRYEIRDVPVFEGGSRGMGIDFDDGDSEGADAILERVRRELGGPPDGGQVDLGPGTSEPLPVPPSVDWGRPRGPVQTMAVTYRGVRVAVVSAGFGPEDSGGLRLEEAEHLEVSFTLKEAPGLEGVVRDSLGAAVAGATVVVRGWIDGPFGPLAGPISAERVPRAVLATTAADDGAFVLPSLPEGLFVLECTAPGCVRTELFAPTGVPLAIELPRAGSAGVLLVHGAHGLPIRNATVVLRGAEGERARGTTDPQGWVSFSELAAGEYEAQVFRGNMRVAGRRFEVTPDEHAELELELDDGFVLSGRLAGLGDARGEVVAITGESGERAHADLDEDGSFELSSLPAGPYRLLFCRRQKGGSGMIYAERELELDGTPGPRSLVVRVEERRPGRLELRVLDVDGAPVPKASVVVHREPLAIIHHRTRTDEQGWLRLDLHPGQYRLRVSHRNHRAEHRELEIRDGDRTPLDVELTTPTAVAETPSKLLSSRRLPNVLLHLTGSLRVRTLLDLLNHLTAGAIEVDPAVEASGVLDRQRVWGTLNTRLGPVLDHALREAKLRLEPRDDGVVIVP